MFYELLQSVVTLTRRSMAKRLMRSIMICCRRVSVLDTNRAHDGHAMLHAHLRQLDILKHLRCKDDNLHRQHRVIYRASMGQTFAGPGHHPLFS